MIAQPPLQASMVSLARIWNRSPHNAFTDLIRFRGRWLCCFREGSAHAQEGGRGGNGRIRILSSADGRAFASSAVLSRRGTDLRDPKLSIAPDGRLMLLFGATRFRRGRYSGRRPAVSFSSDGAEWSEARPLLGEGDWLWRVAWHRRRAYGVTYRLENARRWSVTLVESGDGMAYREVAPLAVTGKPNETTVRFREDGEACALVRREAGDKRAWLGWSRPPYLEWTWADAGVRIGGPNLLFLPGGSTIVAGRMVRGREVRTSLAAIENGALRLLIDLPSGGDCGYPGLVFHGGLLWVSYYSSHEGRTAVYLARVRLAPRSH